MCERGFTPDQSTVTVVGAEGTLNLNTHAKDAVDLMRVIAESMVHPAEQRVLSRRRAWLMMAPEHAEIFKRGGLSKADVKARLWELTKMPARHMAAKDLLRVKSSRTEELGEIGPDTDTYDRPPGGRHLFDGRRRSGHAFGLRAVFRNSRAITRAVNTAG